VVLLNSCLPYKIWAEMLEMLEMLALQETGSQCSVTGLAGTTSALSQALGLLCGCNASNHDMACGWYHISCVQLQPQSCVGEV
jgi:hypothetical protein